ncbi:hypothetical protein EC991_000647 [Linnemannia zychae]|nr:hypothetical protein EC991_000647 [Linnemannia zychae]
MVHRSYFKYPAEYYRRTQWTYPDTLRVRGSVIPSVITDVVLITTFSASLLAVEKSNILPRSLNIPSVIVPALSVVVGLILAFRTNTAYDRFWEGRKLWANLDVQIRNFSRMIWVGVKDTPHEHASEANGSSSGSSPRRNLLHAHNLFGKSNSSLKAKAANGSNGGVIESRVQNVSSSTLIDIDSPPLSQQIPEDVHGDDYEKIVIIRLLLAFAVSVKHHLRQEFGVRYFDLEALLPEGYEFCSAYETVETRMAHDKALGDRQLRHNRHFNEEPWTITSGNDEGQMSLPLEIAHGLSLWVIAQSRASKIETSLLGNLFSSINTMTDIFTNMERIVFTPIPLAYSIHLRQVVYLYCLALPFTFLDVLGWLTVPLMCLVSFTLFGMEAIGREIENPFGKDENDLHMDEFCRDLKRELDYTVNLNNTVPGCHL